MRRITFCFLSSIFLLLFSGNAQAGCVPIGPFGGDVRSLVTSKVQRVAIPPSKEGIGLLVASAHNGVFFNSSWQLLLTHLREPSQ